MPVTELAVFRLNPGITLDHPTLHSLLSRGKVAMESFQSSKGNPKKFYFLQQTEDPSCIYIVGWWDSVAEHMNEFIPAPENQSIMNEMKEAKLDSLDYFGHFDCDQEKIAVEAPVVSVGIHKVAKEKKEAFEKKFDEVKGKLDDYMWKGTKPVAGWRLDLPKEEAESENAMEQFVLFCGWDSLERHTKDFISSEGATEYRQIAKFVDSFDIKHARVVEL
ncbi:hypothetical protein NA57DRAFT_72776 [Rhizodiscina lignyota]|uniref:ABM domain-containing protein n=1 Tax=Rhizodiscina lignyota TaxID=1504668 RepID=A0A9P4IL86_9PEZI|nr:hypothetical protein NA57DRAFT_72776 [Rhizodiscina lignyota]